MNATNAAFLSAANALGGEGIDLKGWPSDAGAWFRSLADDAPQIVWSAMADGTPDYFNPAWRRLAGPVDAERAGDPWTGHVHPDEISETLARWRASLGDGRPFAIEHRIGDAAAGWRWFVDRAWAVRGDGGGIVRWFGFGVDIDDVVRHGVELERMVAEREEDLARANTRVLVEAAGRREEATARRDVDALNAAYIDNTSDGVFVVEVNEDGSIAAETINRVLEAGLRIDRDQIQGLPLAGFMPGATASQLVEKIAECVALRDSLRYEEATEIDGADRVFEVTLAPVGMAEGRVDRVVGSVRDLTERREAEQQLRQAQKMEAVGQLTGGVAHDFNNLLQVVKGNLDLLAHELSDVMTPAIARRLRDAMSGAERGAKLTRQLLAFSRRQPLAPKPTDVGSLVASMSEMLERTLGETVEVSIERDAGGWTALVDPQQLENAVLNLAINARDAMPNGGRLSITVRNLAGCEGADAIELSVADSGAGMTQQVLSRVFEPFFSTKPEGRGTGLGLPQVQGFIEQSSGRIEIESAVGRGTTVRLSLPRSAAAAVVEAPPAVLDARGAGERILVLEDDDAVRHAVSDLLASLGYAVTQAGTTREGAAILDSGAPFELLLSDVVMPGSPSPPELARLARAQRPELKVLFMSGYAEDAIVHHGRVDPDVHLIEKPYAKDELAQKLRMLLDRPRKRTGPVHVLLVEDEPLIAMGVSDLLTSFGYTVVEARNGAEAKAAVARGDTIDVMLTDLGLPDIDGEDLAEWFRTERPRAPILFATGRDDFTAPPLLAAGGPVAVLTKPFDSRSLRQIIDALVG